ncbi:hypothetical protein HQO83_20315 [Rhodococcus fascians]|nr:hypothetical protein [Rhodococcus fascians]
MSLRIEVLRTGGIAGMSKRGVIETDEPEWQSLVEAARPYLAEPPPPEPADSQARDTFTWSVSVGEQSCRVGDSALTGPLRDLAERALREGRVR